MRTTILLKVKGLIILSSMTRNKKQIWFYLFFLIISFQTDLLCREEGSYPKIGIALSGGGIRGIAHIGVLRRLEEEGIKIYMISGSSMGAMIGGLYALGYNTYEIEKIIKEAETKDVFTNKPDRDNTENYLKKTSDRTVVELELTEDGIRLPNALNNGHKVLKKLREFVLSSEYYTKDFDKLKYKLRVICSDIQSAKKVVFKEGDLPMIILGSMSFPGLFKPAIYKDMKLLDGGLTDNIPTSALEDCDFIFASNTTYDTPSGDKEYNFIELLDRISVMMTKTNTDKSLERADIVFRPQIEDISMTELDDPDSLIRLGYIAADEKIEEIKELINFSRYVEIREKSISILDLEIAGNTVYSDEEIITEISSIDNMEDILKKTQKKYRENGYILSKVEFIKGSEKDTLKISEGVIKKIDIFGDYKTKKSYIREELAVSKGEILNLSDIESSIDNLYGTGLFNKVSYDLNFEESKVVFYVEEKPYYLIRIGANYQTDRGFLGLIEGTNKNLHGKRAELYGGLTYGEKFNRIEFSYYNPFLKRSSLFFELLPYYQVREREFYTDHKKLEDFTYDEKRVGANFNLGFQLFDNYQGTFTIVQEYLDYENVHFNKTAGILKVLADSRNDQIIPSRGLYFSWNMETGMYEFENDMKYQKIWWEFSVYHKIKNRLFYEVGVCGGTGDKLVPQAERYLIGGIRMMPGTYFEEYSEIQYLRLKLKQNLLIYKATLFDTYLTLGYYFNGFWSEPEIEWNYKDFMNSAYIGITLNSSFGPVEFGWGLTAGNGEIENNNRLFLSFGYSLQ